MNIYNKQFELREETPAYWHNKSNDLLVSARTLWEAMQKEKALVINCWSTYKMLMGMSFELLFKAHCVGAGIRFGATHDLVSLAKTANFTMSKEENGILNVLSEYIIWDGRYPIPKRSQHLENHWKSQNKVLNDKKSLGGLTVQTPNDKLDFDNLLPIWRNYSELYMDRYN
ncbi:hypothetical protein [Pseudoalteromonas gelatinilytica]|uniref:hypothetical protein n=1 Tax=Pseudoalteromonas gelatinilytica TaxID=1703256 RepID=UPI0007C59A9A|nr:hypothetical protein [Pseudoalteromonas gelatinilytica]